MPRFRTSPPSTTGRLTPEGVRRLIADVLSPGHFFTGDSTCLEWEHGAHEEVAWEVFQGRLLDPAHSRQRQVFESWNVYPVEDDQRSAEPVLAVKLAAAADRLHVVRAVYCYAWEGYNAGGNVILSRETCKWVRELVATLDLQRFSSEADLLDELICQLFRAVVGTSRLPLTSLEAPLPAFSLGELAYCYRTGLREERPARSYQELVDRFLAAELSWLEQAKLLETLLHAAPEEEFGSAIGLFVERWRTLGREAREIVSLLRTLFNEVSLSPYTDLVDRTLAVLRTLEGRRDLSATDVTDLLGHLLRQSGRHLTAYDLVIFHHRGANYPDALLLDALLKAYLDRIERHPALVRDDPAAQAEERRRKRLRRRALRQAWLLRHRYEGHPVPDAPTSQGESLRVLPSPHPRVPEEQILQPGRRTRHLFAGDALTERLGPSAREALHQSLADLHEPSELRELGTALFLDRPFGMAKGPVEPDRTLLLSHVAYSRSIAEARLKYLAEKLRLIEPAECEALRQRLLTRMPVRGVAVAELRCESRPGTVSLADARMAADDFVLLRSTQRAVGDLLTHYDFRPLAEHVSLDWLAPDQAALIVGEPTHDGKVALTLYDAGLRPRLELSFHPGAGYVSRAGTEYPSDGLHVQRTWEKDSSTGEWRERGLEKEAIVLRPTV